MATSKMHSQFDVTLTLKQYNEFITRHGTIELGRETILGQTFYKKKFLFFRKKTTKKWNVIPTKIDINFDLHDDSMVHLEFAVI